MLRIISGKYKGFRLKAVPSKKTKNTSHLVRKALFDTISNDLEKAVVLDLFAGSGSYGFEALSRGVSQVYLVDNLFVAVQTIKQNQKKMAIDNQKTIIWHSDAFRALKILTKRKIIFDLIILDPPYFSNFALYLFPLLVPLTHSQSQIVYETYHKVSLPMQTNPFVLFKQHKYGAKKLYYYRKLL